VSDAPPASVRPSTASDLDRFLSRVGDDVVLDVRYAPTGMGDEVAVAAGRADVDRPSGGPVFRFVTPTGATAVGAELVDRVVARAPPLTRADYGAGDDDALAAALARVAREAPALVDVDHVRPLLGDAGGDGDGAVAAEAWRALSALCAARPGDCAPALDRVLAELAGGGTAAGAARSCLVRVAAADPAAVAGSVDRVGRLLDADEAATARAGAAALADVAEAHPTAVVGCLPALEGVLHDEERGRTKALWAVSRVARAAPEHVAPLSPTLVSVLGRPSAGDVAVANAAVSLGLVAKAYGTVPDGAADAAAAHLDREARAARNNAVGLLADLAVFDVDAVRPHVDVVARLLTDPDDRARANASAVVARVAERDRDAAVPWAGTGVDLLDDDADRVRENACWLLGHLGVPAGRSELERLRSEDPCEDVRERAAWALSRRGVRE
jgi:hypothetical protein